MQFELSSAFEIEKSGNKLIDHDKAALKRLWESVDEDFGDFISRGVGVYIFSIKAGKGILPWYVGMAEKQPFCMECFGSHKLLHYNNAIAARKGTPVITLIAKMTAGGKLAKPSKNGHKDIQLLETMLIGSCLKRNSELMNIKDTKHLREMVVPGYLNNPKGRDTKRIKSLQEIIGAGG